MHCPSCLTEYRAGFATCSDCGAALAEGAPPHRQPSGVNAPASLEEVLRTDDPLQAEMAAALLDDAGIETVVRSQFHGGLTLTAVETHWAPGQQRIVLVPSVSLPSARAVLAALPPPDGNVASEGTSEPLHPTPQVTSPSHGRWVAALILLPVLGSLLYAALLVLQELFR